jgi:hypothetical protein
MTKTYIKLTEPEFEQRYKLVPNHLNPNASWRYGDVPGHLFETYGEELAFVRRQNPRTVWTLVEEDDAQYLQSGFHLVNRLGYLISRTAVPEDTEIQVRLLSPSEN